MPKCARQHAHEYRIIDDEMLWMEQIFYMYVGGRILDILSRLWKYVLAYLSTIYTLIYKKIYIENDKSTMYIRNC